MSAWITYAHIKDEVIRQMQEVFSSQSQVKVKGHCGVFSQEDIRKATQEAPSILTSLMKISYLGSTDVQLLKFVTWVFVRGTSNDRQFHEALVLLSWLVPALKKLDTAWSYGGASQIEAENLYSYDLGSANVGLWAVGWNWSVKSCVLSDEDGGIPVFDLDLFKGYDARHQVGTQEVGDHVTFKE